MSLAISVQADNGHFTATLLGDEKVVAHGANRHEAINALRRELMQRVDRGEIVEVDVEPIGLSDLAGKFADDPTLDEICEEAYRERDRDAERFP